MTSEAELSPSLAMARGVAWLLRSRWVREAVGVLLLAIAYFAAAKVGQTLRYTASVSAIWPPAGLGIAALYLWGRVGDGHLHQRVVRHADLLSDHTALPLGSLIGQHPGLRPRSERQRGEPRYVTSRFNALQGLRPDRSPARGVRRDTRPMRA